MIYLQRVFLLVHYFDLNCVFHRWLGFFKFYFFSKTICSKLHFSSTAVFFIKCSLSWEAVGYLSIFDLSVKCTSVGWLFIMKWCLSKVDLISFWSLSLFVYLFFSYPSGFKKYLPILTKLNAIIIKANTKQQKEIHENPVQLPADA